MLQEFVRLVEKLTGSLLAGLAVSAQVANTLICVGLVLFGMAAMLGLRG